jgi:hypothetical protein
LEELINLPSGSEAEPSRIPHQTANENDNRKNMISNINQQKNMLLKVMFKKEEKSNDLEPE